MHYLATSFDEKLYRLNGSTILVQGLATSALARILRHLPAKWLKYRREPQTKVSSQRNANYKKTNES